MTMASVDYGYGDAAPDGPVPDAVDYGYGDAAPETTDYGYGDATPDTIDYGYGDATPETTDYGYGDAAPDTDITPPVDVDDASKYGYGEEADTPANDASKYGYGDDEPTAAGLGYGEYTSGYNDGSGATGGEGGGSSKSKSKPKRIQRNNSNELGYESTHSAHSTSASVESYGSYGDGEAPEQPRRQRYRRRGSVTKYSIESTTEVQQENQDLCQPNREYTMPADNSYDPETYNAKYNSAPFDAAPTGEEDQFDADGDTNGHDDSDPKKKKKGNKMMKGLRQMSKRRFSTHT
jgi:hypothetical protein